MTLHFEKEFTISNFVDSYIFCTTLYNHVFLSGSISYYDVVMLVLLSIYNLCTCDFAPADVVNKHTNTNNEI